MTLCYSSVAREEEPGHRLRREGGREREGRRERKREGEMDGGGVQN